MDGTCLTHRTQASKSTEALLAKGSLVKFTTYCTSGALDPAQYTLYPVVFEQFGAASSDVHALVRVFARRQADMSNGQLRFSWCVAHWRQLLSVALQRGVSRAVDFAWARMELAAGGPVPDLGAYQASRLPKGVRGAGNGAGGAPGDAGSEAGIRDNNVDSAARPSCPTPSGGGGRTAGGTSRSRVVSN